MLDAVVAAPQTPLPVFAQKPDSDSDEEDMFDI